MNACMECSAGIEEKAYVMYEMYQDGRRLFQSNKVYLICGRDFGVIPDDLKKAAMPQGRYFVFEEAECTGDGFPQNNGNKRFVDAETVAAYLPFTSKSAEKQTNPENYHLVHKKGVLEMLRELLSR